MSSYIPLYFYSFFYSDMKITRKEIDLLTEAIVGQIYDSDKIAKAKQEERDALSEKAWAEFEKSKQWKQVKKIFEENQFVKEFSVNEEEFFGKVISDYYYKWKTYRFNRDTYETNVRNDFCMRYIKIDEKKYPTKEQVATKVNTLLTIEALGGEDIKSIVGSVADAVKKEFKL